MNSGFKFHFGQLFKYVIDLMYHHLSLVSNCYFLFAYAYKVWKMANIAFKLCICDQDIDISKFYRFPLGQLVNMSILVHVE